MQSCGEALNDEAAALNSIYGDETVVVASSSLHETSAVLRPPDIHYSFLLSFPSEYPDVPPQIRGTNSTGSSGRGDGETAVNTLRQVLGTVYRPGQVCLFDLLEEAGPLLLVHNHDSAEDTAQYTPDRLVSSASAPSAAHSLTVDPAAGLPAPSWVVSELLTLNKSHFVARACPVSSMSEVTDAVSHLIATNKKVASATHNIKAWRFKDAASGTRIVQDHDDDGEAAAGGRLLHLLQLMHAWNLLVVVTRWYGGVKLGPDRFRVINNVARDVVVKGGFAKLEEMAKGILARWKIQKNEVSGVLEHARGLWNEDTKNGVVDRLRTPAYAMLGTAGLFNEENKYSADTSDETEMGFDNKSLEDLKEELRLLYSA